MTEMLADILTPTETVETPAIEVPEAEELFCIDDDSKADWAVRKIAEHRAEIDKWDNHFKNQLERIRATEQASIDYLTRLLKDYFTTVPHKTTKTEESYRLPSGKVYMKEQLPKYIRNEDEMTAWAKENRPELVKTTVTETTDWNTLKKATTTLDDGSVVDSLTGEVIPGVKAEMRMPEFKIDC